ncbi:MAG: Uma2 family endonuclease [Archangium sp.]|nr:Uma2 family endonuclease [Archangium sp.]
MSTARRLHYTYRDYLDVEQMSDARLEFYNGEIYAMAGGTPEHAFLAAACSAQLTAQLPKGCRVASSDLKISVVETGLSTYPDLSVVCGPAERDARDANAVTNPVLLVEVTSPSTQDYDRGEKLSHYKQISSLQCVVIVGHAEKCVTLVQRTASGWAMTDVRPGELAVVASPSLSIDVSALYASLDGV